MLFLNEFSFVDEYYSSEQAKRQSEGGARERKQEKR